MVRVEMHFMADVFVECDACQGRRYNRETLAVKFKDKNIADVLEMPVAEAVQFFENHPIIRRCGPGVHVLALYQGDPVLVSSGRHLIATFHPELSGDRTIQRRFLASIPPK